jgi:hypothetical protein
MDEVNDGECAAAALVKGFDLVQIVAFQALHAATVRWTVSSDLPVPLGLVASGGSRTGGEAGLSADPRVICAGVGRPRFGDYRRATTYRRRRRGLLAHGESRGTVAAPCGHPSLRQRAFRLLRNGAKWHFVWQGLACGASA